MAKEVRLPKFSDEMTEGAVSRWLKAVGDTVEEGEPIVEVETEKVIVEVEAPHGGVLVEIVAQEHERVPVDGVLCRIGKASEVKGGQTKDTRATGAGLELATAPLAPRPGQSPPPAAASNVVSMPQRSHPAPGIGSATPLARRVAESLGIDLSALAGSGAGGKIVMADLQPYVNAAESGGTVTAPPRLGDASARPTVADPPPDTARQTHGPLRRTVARRMAESKAAIPHFYMTAEVDVTQALALRERLNRSGTDVRITVNDLMIKAAALALEAVPALNAEFTDDAPRRFPEIHIGFATAIDEGLFTPVVRDCHLKSIGRIARETKELIASARARRLSAGEMQGATFTLSNLGMYPVLEFSAIINPPQVGILAIARPVERPVADRGRVVFRQLMNATLSADHRAVDGVTGAEFLRAFKDVLESPERLML